MDQKHYEKLTCKQCINAENIGFDFSFAFQPIISKKKREIIAYEALVRGLEDKPSSEVFRHINEGNLYRFDQSCRVKAIALAARIGIKCNLNINFTPNAIYKPELCIRTTLDAADEYNFPINKITFEVTEAEKIRDHAHLAKIIRTYQELGFTTSIDDFGAGYSGLNLLAEFQPDYIKLDRALIMDIHEKQTKQSIVRGIITTCNELSIGVLAEGIEKTEEYQWLAQAGIDMFQGYLFARPGFETLPEVTEELFDL